MLSLLHVSSGVVVRAHHTLRSRGEVWSLDVDPAERRVATGSADNELRLYAVVDEGDEGTRVSVYAQGWASVTSNEQTCESTQHGPGEVADLTTS